MTRSWQTRRLRLREPGGAGALTREVSQRKELRVEARSRDLTKKREEVALCLRVAQALNELDSADYDVPDAEWQLSNPNEPADVIFISASGAHPSRGAQITTIPYGMNRSDLGLRDDNGNIRKFERGVREALLRRGAQGWQIDVHLTQEGELRKPRSSQIEQLTELIWQRACEGPWAVPWEKIWESSEDLAKFVSDVSGWPLSSGALLVNAGRGCFIPENRNFIEEAVRAKSSDKKYSSLDTSRLILVIGAASTILPGHIETYRRECNPSEIPFSEVWIVPAFSDRAIPVKRPPRPQNSSAPD